MKIAFAGKGGSGKTTLSSLFVRHCSAARRPAPDLAARTSHLPGCHGCRRTHDLHAIKPKYPAADPAVRDQMMQARAELAAELGIERAGAEQAGVAPPH